MPISVALAATLQLALTATFVVLPVVVYFYGGSAQRAAEAETIRQGVPVEVLAEHRIRFEEKAWEFLLAIGIAAALATLAGLNLSRIRTGLVLSWIAEPVVLVAVGFVCASQVLAVRYTQAAFAKSGDPRVREIDAAAVIGAASAAMPSWIRAVVVVRFGLATLGSLLVILLLLTPSANAYFH
ncbi:hypothetical protein [Actinoallomurus sp. NPDC050550]|uniref:hypothetical protein n=1 Tax=Actinoallomurus sp. NPDC050550 TaxID=3154937 RepID=UPI0033F7D1B6